MNDQTTEQAIQAAGADKAPRVTPADIEANIAHEIFLNAGECAVAFAPEFPNYKPPPASAASLGLLTICVLVLRNGFTVTGESACASPENFNAEIGRRIARENAIAKCWPLMGYALKERLSAQQ